MKKVALIIVALWLLLAGGIMAAEKDCGQEDIKVEAGGRYLIEAERVYSNMVLYISPPASYVTSIEIKEISKSSKYALGLKLNEKDPLWVLIKDLKIIERLPEGGWKASSAELGSNTLELKPTPGTGTWRETLDLKPTPGPWKDMKGR